MVAGTVKIKNFFCASRFVPASKLQKESEKNKNSVQSMVKNLFFFICAMRFVLASKLQQESVKKNELCNRW